MQKPLLLCLLVLVFCSCSPDHRLTRMIDSVKQEQYNLQFEAAESEAAQARRFCQRHPRLPKSYPLEVALESASLAIENSQLGKARGLLLEADQLLSSSSDFPSRLKLLHRVNWGKYYYKKGRPDSAMILSRQLEELLSQSKQDYPEVQLEALQLAGAIYLQLGEAPLAAEAFEQAQVYLEAQGEELPLQIQLLSSLSFIYGRLGDLVQQESSLKAAESLFQQHPDISPLAKALYYNNLAKSYQMQAEFRASQLSPEEADSDFAFFLLSQKTIECLEEARKWVMQSNSQLDQATVLMGLGEAKMKQDMEAALALLKAAEEKILATVGKQSYYYFGWLFKRGNACFVQKDYHLARFYWRQSEKVGKEILGPVHPAMGMLQFHLAGSFLWEGKRKGDHALLRRGLKQLDTCFAAFAEKVIPSAQGPRFEGVNELTGLHTALRDKGFVYANYPALSPNPATAYREALKYYQAAISVGEEQLLRFALDETQRRALPQLHNYLTEAILLCIRLYELGEKGYLEKAFALSERSRAFSLRRSRKSREALRFASMPEQLLKEEQRLLAQLSRLHALQNTLPSSDQKQALSRDLSRTQQAFSQFRKQLRRDYPHYYQWTHQLQTRTVEEVQQELAQDEVLVEYYSWNIALAFAISRDTFFASYERVPPPDSPYQSPTGLLLEALQEGRQKHDPASFARYHQRAYDWYKRFLAPVLTPMPQARKLILVPDGYALGMPFEMLLTEPAGHEPGPLPYLLEAYDITYAFSATTYFYPDFLGKKAAPPASPFVAFAPDFEAFNAGQAYQLAGCGGVPQTALQAGGEVKKLQKMLGGKVWEGKAARRATFLREAPKAKVLHLHTHGCADFDNPLGSRIFLADSAVLLPELMALPLQAELVFLSVCQTGTGAILPGEGVMSMATAFAQAGCPGVVAGMWNIPEQASAWISRRFYEYLSQEKRPAAALRQAKLDYLKREEGPRLHPYYWAGLVFIGRMK